ncbi:hypothetical protein H9P43_009760 [Blastocladiella emersonii ATCC 22665]|nr:hypothetical protein H9P43_009760 [Blastocladiella emersonii ATCC 22665]
MKAIFLDLAIALVTRDVGDRKRWAILRSWACGRLPVSEYPYVRLHRLAMDHSAINAMLVVSTWTNRNGRNLHDMYVKLRRPTRSPLAHAIQIVSTTVAKRRFTPEQIAPLLRAKFYSACQLRQVHAAVRLLLAQPPEFCLDVLLDAPAHAKFEPDSRTWSLESVFESIMQASLRGGGAIAVARLMADLTILAHAAGYEGRGDGGTNIEIELVNGGIEPVRARVEALLPERNRAAAVKRLDALLPVFGANVLGGTVFSRPWRDLGVLRDPLPGAVDETLQQARWWYPNATIIRAVSERLVSKHPSWPAAAIPDVAQRFPICFHPNLHNFAGIPKAWRLRSEPFTDAEWHALHADLMAVYRRESSPADDEDAVAARWQWRVMPQDRGALQALIDVEYPGMPRELDTDEALDAHPLGVNGLGLQMITVVQQHTGKPGGGRWLAENVTTLRGRPWRMSGDLVRRILTAPWASRHKVEVVAFLTGAQRSGVLSDPILCDRVETWCHGATSSS